MMASMQVPQNFPHPGGMQHPGVPPGHHMAPGMAHNPSQPGSQPGIPHHLAHQMAASGAGGQVNPALMGAGMPPGANAHAMQHLNPNVQHMFPQQPVTQMNYAAAQQHMQQQRLQALQQQQRQMMAQHMYGNMPGGMQMMGNMQINPAQMAQFQAMQQRQMAARQQQAPNPQQQALLAAQQQQLIQAQHHQQQQAASQQMAQGQHPNQPGQMNSQQINLAQLQAMQHAHQAQQQQAQQQQQQQAQQQQQQQAQQQQQQQAQQQQQQQAQQQQQQQAQQQQQQAAQQQASHQTPPQQQPQQPQAQPGPPQPTPQQQIGQGGPAQANGPQPNPGQPQGPNQAQPSQQQPPQPPQPAQQQPQAQAQPNQPQAAQLVAAQHQASMMAQAQKREGMKGHCLLRLMNFQEHLSGYSSQAKDKDIAHWQEFVHRFFSPRGIYRTNVRNKADTEASGDKQVEMNFPAIPHYFQASGASKIELQLGQGTTDKPLPGDCHFIENSNASVTMWFETSHVVHVGNLRLQFDAESKIDLFEFVSTDHDEYVSRTVVVDGAKPNHQWIKEWRTVNSENSQASPEMSKKSKPRPKKSPQNPPPDLDIPHSAVKHGVGITEQQYQFLEIVEVMGTMNPLFQAAHQHPTMSAYQVLDDYVSNQIPQPGAPAMNGQVMPNGPRTPGFGQFPMGASPHAAHLQLPGSPHVGSPAAGAMQAPAMAMQHSQQGSSSNASATTSPAGQKRRRPSGVKVEEDTPGNAPTPSAAGGVPQVNGVAGNKTKPPTPRMQKRMKGNPA